MKNLTILIFALLFTQLTAFSQPCLPEGIIFTSQEEIDNFQTNYPNCTEIEGDVYIGGPYGSDITNLDGLSVLTSIGVGLNFSWIDDLSLFQWHYYNPLLASLAGLSNVISIGGNVNISHLESLTGLSGLENLTSIGGDLQITENQPLTSLYELSNVTSIGGDLVIENNDLLNNLTGLDNINAASIEDLYIHDNNSLSTCEVESLCDYLATLNGTVNIYDNASGCNNPVEVANACGFVLPCLPYGNYYFCTQSEINNFQTNYPGCTHLEGDVKISGNDITDLGGLNVVTSIGEQLHIRENASLVGLTGLENLTSVGETLGILENIALVTLAGIDNVNFVGEELEIVDNDALINLTGLENLNSLGGQLYIRGNGSLVDLTGLENLTSIGGGLQIRENNALITLTGLESLTFIGEGLGIADNGALTTLTGLDNVYSIGGDLWIYQNSFLTSLTALNNLTAIAGVLTVRGNHYLKSLTGLDNIEADSIADLFIRENFELSHCEVQSICDYLANPNGWIWINNNAPGCASPVEVEEACWTSVNEIGYDDKIIISPNPLESTTLIQYNLYKNSPVTLQILDLSGRLVVSLVNEVQQQGEQRIEFNTSGLPAGIYFCVLKTNQKIQTIKLIKH